jgi:demethylmenaquinone methyltransferase/2-methoxy-6-polyprenyl-1,4-benzoquinol methylase
MRAGHAVYFRRMVPMIGGVLSDREAYAYLPKSMAYLPPVTEMVTALRDAGFTDAVRVRLSGGIAQVLVGTRA